MSEEQGEKTKVLQSNLFSQFDKSFSEEVMKHHGCERLSMCYQCGSCAGSCPVGKITTSYKPRQIIRMTMLGLKNEVLSNDSIWLCAACFTCQERCPQGVKITDIMLTLRSLASQNGHAPAAFIEQASLLIENGRLVRLTGLVERKRAELGLGTISPVNNEVVKNILSKTGFIELVEKLKR
ncbi:MAG: 4Fe-4S dicluster domain-containing protein [Candidatus Bathyarchaeia archaeon]